MCDFSCAFFVRHMTDERMVSLGQFVILNVELFI